jgi:hypothetical protein
MDPATTSRTGPDHLPVAAALRAVAALSDQLRRQMYGFIRRAHRPVSREEAADTVGISRKLAAFHLDKLVEVGLLRARYEPIGGIRKVGRTPTSSSTPYSPQTRARPAPRPPSRLPVTAAPSSAPPNANGPGQGV